MKHRIFLKARFFSVILLVLLYPSVSSSEVKVGVIYSGYIPYYRQMHYAFARELIKRLPHKEKVKFVRQRPSPDTIAWSNAARKLVVTGVDLIVTYGYPATNAAISKRSGIPIVYAGVYKPDATMDKSKGEATGCGYNLSLPILFEHLTKIMPIKKLHVVYTHKEPDSIVQMKEVAKLAEQKNINMVDLNISSDEDLKELYTIKDGDGLIITGSVFVHSWIESIMSIVQTKKIPTVDIFPGSEELGILMSYYQDAEEMGLEAAEIAAKILAGTRPENIESVVMTEADLNVNMKEAKRLGSTIPDQLVAKAIKIIK